jgi:hypothetical protein
MQFFSLSSYSLSYDPVLRLDCSVRREIDTDTPVQYVGLQEFIPELLIYGILIG